MAYVNSNTTTVGLVDRLVSALTSVKEAIARRRLYLRTLSELNALSDRDLTDLGLSRASVADVAREAAYTN
jgi:uncharacterized protein YjiS (DUF1127 family)